MVGTECKNIIRDVLEGTAVQDSFVSYRPGGKGLWKRDGAWVSAEEAGIRVLRGPVSLSLTLDLVG